MRTFQSSKEAGFTLVELLIALILLVVMSLMLFQVIHTTIHVSAISKQRTQKSSLEAAQSFIQNAIEQAVELEPSKNDGTKVVSLSGNRREIDFVSQYIVLGQFGGVHRYKIRFEASGSGGEQGRLVLKWSQYRSGQNTEEVIWREEVLLDRVRKVSFGYFGRHNNQRRREWHNLWQQTTLLPSLVSVRIVRSAERTPQAAPLIVRLELRPNQP